MQTIPVEDIKAVLHEWVARRAGGYITIEHSAGKVTNVLNVYIRMVDVKRLVAETVRGDFYILEM